MKRVVLCATLLLLTALVSLIVHFPAYSLYQWVAKQPWMPNSLNVKGIIGTPWQGHAQSLQFGQRDFGPVHWQINTNALWSRQLDYDLKLPGGSIGLSAQSQVVLSREQQYLFDTTFTLPAAELLKDIPSPIALKFQGQLSGDIPLWQYQSPWCREAKGDLLWQDGAIKTPFGQLTFSAQKIKLRCSHQKLELFGRTNTDQLTADWHLQLQPNHQYQVKGWVLPGPQLPNKMREGLQFMGAADVDGHYPFNFNGKW